VLETDIVRNVLFVITEGVRFQLFDHVRHAIIHKFRPPRKKSSVGRGA
jgi:hypothetical protein